jgi:hypothetical protein
MSNTTVNQARKILETHSPKEVAAKIGYKSAGTLYAVRSGKANMGDKLAVKIVEAYGDKPGKPGPKKQAAPAEKPEKETPQKKAWNTPSQGMKPEQRQAQQDQAKLAEEAYALLSKIGMAGAARAALAKVVEEELKPVLVEMLGEAIREAKEGNTLSVVYPEYPDSVFDDLPPAPPLPGDKIRVSVTNEDGSKYIYEGDVSVGGMGMGEIGNLEKVAGEEPPVDPDPNLVSYEPEQPAVKKRWWRR